jgi:hypothetical protein
LDIPALARAWAAREVCEPQESVEVLQDPDPRAEEVRWHRWSCDGQRLVEHYSFKRGGHHWPGHPRSVGSLSVDATATMWDFFQAHASSSAQKQGPGGSFGTSALVRKRADRSMLGVATGLANAVELPVKTGTGKRAVRLRLLDFINRIARQRFAGMDVRRRPQ